MGSSNEGQMVCLKTHMEHISPSIEGRRGYVKGIGKRKTLVIPIFVLQYLFLNFPRKIIFIHL